MFAIILDGVIQQLVQAGTAFTYNDIQYPANWCNLSSPEEKAAIGMVDVVYGPQPSQTFYWVSENAPVYNAQTNQVDITFTSTPKDLFTLQSNMVNTVNQTAWTILSPSDWMVVKATETGGTVPANWNTWRQTIRTQAADAVSVISACTTVDQLAALPSINWALSPDQQTGAI
jgi:hypothetical protein